MIQKDTLLKLISSWQLFLQQFTPGANGLAQEERMGRGWPSNDI
jgi:hypothetical protein